MPAVKPKFGAEEKVLCFHGPLLYEAKVMKAAKIEKTGPKANQPFYLIHYQGWRKSWDEWVPETRILKHNEENLQKQRQLKGSAVSDKNKKRKAEAAKDEEAPAKTEKRRKSRHQPVEHVQVDDEFKNKPEVNIPVPDDLKRQLVDDWDFVTRQKKLVGLPRTPSVQDIVNQYLSERNFTGHNLELAKEVTAGLITYFDHCIGTILLYRFERVQYVDILAQVEAKNEADEDEAGSEGKAEAGSEGKAESETTTTSLNGKKMSEIYGAEHLLRLFVKLPSILAHTDLEEDNCKVLVDSFQDILKFLSRNAQDCFLQDYENASAGHMRTAA